MTIRKLVVVVILRCFLSQDNKKSNEQRESSKHHSIMEHTGEFRKRTGVDGSLGPTGLQQNSEHVCHHMA
jgi:hypothetical protein